MARQLIRIACCAIIVVAPALQGCGKPSPDSANRPPHAAAARAAAAGPLASRPEANHGRTDSERLPVASAPPVGQYQSEDSPPWLAELLHAPDRNVRIQALDAWAREPTGSLDPVTYALVDPDESVRARAQEVLEQELARR